MTARSALITLGRLHLNNASPNNPTQNKQDLPVKAAIRLATSNTTMSLRAHRDAMDARSTACHAAATAVSAASTVSINAWAAGARPASWLQHCGGADHPISVSVTEIETVIGSSNWMILLACSVIWTYAVHDLRCVPNTVSASWTWPSMKLSFICVLINC